ncbi:MAG: hypothetical protein ACSLFP_01525 [Acidimicrobiales bacterium]
MRSAKSLVRRPTSAALLLLVALGALSLLLDPRGSLGADTGAKVATLETMAQRGGSSVDVGYWAEDWDPEGRVHPLFQTTRTDDGWVAVTTLPMLLLAAPLYDFGGYRLALLLPMLGVVGCAFAGRGLARRLVESDDGWSAFWYVGLGSPLVLYGLDFWEHAPGVACVGGAAVLLFDAVRGPWVARAIGAGLLLGAAASMRTEALVYAFVLVGAAVVQLAAVAGRSRAAVGVGGAALLGFSGSWLANQALERAVGGLSRATRASGALGGAGSADRGLPGSAGRRLGEGMVTLFGFRGDGATSVAAGLGLLLLIAVAVWAARRGDRRLMVFALGGLAAVHVVAGIVNPAFVPGMVVAAPIVLLAARTVVEQPGARWVAATALLALPLVWAFQYLGAAGPQWAGRYALPSFLLLASVAMCAVASGRRNHLGLGIVAVSVIITLVGVGFVSYRTHSVAAFFDTVVDLDAEVVVARDGFLLREGGAATVGRSWLSASTEADFALALDIARRSGSSTVAVLSYREPAPPPASVPADFTEVRRTRAELVGVPVGITVYRVDRPSTAGSSP